MRVGLFRKHYIDYIALTLQPERDTTQSTLYSRVEVTMNVYGYALQILFATSRCNVLYRHCLAELPTQYLIPL